MFSDTLHELFANLFAPLTESDGVPQDEIDVAEARLGLALPATMAEFYRLAGRNRIYSEVQDHVLPPVGTPDNELEIFQEALVFYRENQRFYFSGIPLASIGQDDPPVVQGNRGETNWYPEAAALSSFLIQVTCWQAIAALASGGEAEITPEQLAALQTQVPRVDGTESDPDGMTAFCEPGLVCCVFPKSMTLYVGGRSDEIVEGFSERLDVELDWY